MSTHEPVPALSSIAVDPSPYSSLQYTYHSQPLHDILYNEPMIPSYPNVESSFTLRPHPHYPPQFYSSPHYFRSQHPNPNRALIHSAITSTFNPRFSHEPFQYDHRLPQRPRLDTPHPSLCHYNEPSYQTTTANTLTHSSQFSHNSSHNCPSLPQQPIRLDTFSLALVNPLATATAYHSSSHVAHSLSTPFSPHVGQSSDTIPSSSGTTSSRPPSHPSPYSSYCTSLQHSPSRGLPHPKHPRLDTAPSSPLTTLHPTSTVVLHTAGPGYKSTNSVASPTVVPLLLPATTPSPCLQRYVTYLTQQYLAIKTPVYDKESTLLYFKAKSFINIALVHKNVKTMTDIDKKEMIMDRLHGHVDAIQKKKTIINFSNVCKCEDGSVAHSVLVEGAPGVGKTTFAFELCKQWARGEILQEWGVVVIIKLRDQRTRTAQTINDLLYHPDPKLRQAVTELVEQNGEGMLLILDGYDELTTKQREFGSVVQCLMSRELLYRATLMVTSRPLATRTLHPNFQQSIDQHIEVLGFTEKNIEEYINSACGDNQELVEDFKEYLSSHPFSSSLMFNPLQCAIVTDLYRSHWQFGEKGFAPKTLTELYTGLVHTLLLRYLTNHPVHKDRNWRLRDMSDLPEDVKQQLKAVTALAAKGIEDQQYVFDEEDDNVPSETLGLMQREEELTAGIGRSSSHNFLHLTLQEYLAAVNYSQQCDSPEQLTQLLTRDDLFPLSSFLQYYGKKRKRTIHWPVALFLAGRTQLSGVPLDLLKTGLHSSRDNETTVDLSLLHLLYETQCPQLIQSTLVTSKQYISVHGHSALDWFVIGYCIANSTSTWRVEKKTNDVLKHFNQLVMGLKLAPQDGSGKGKIGSLDFSGSWSGNFKILSQLDTFTKSVTDITVVGPLQDVLRNFLRKGNTKFKEKLDGYPLLEFLRIKYAEIEFPYYWFIPQQNNLHTVILEHCKISSEATSSLIHSLVSPDGMLLHNLSLHKCTIVPTDDSYQFSYIDLELKGNCGKFSLNTTSSCCTINHLLLQLSSYSVLLTELILSVTTQNTDVILEGIGLFNHVLEILSINDNHNTCFSFCNSLFLELRQNNLHTLSLTKCKLSSGATSSLIHSLLSQDYKLNKLALYECAIFFSDYTYTFTAFKVHNCNVSLQGECSSSAFNHWLSYLSSYTKLLLTELILDITAQESSNNEILERIGLYCGVLEVVKIRGVLSNYFTLPSLPFIGQQQNNLHTLSLRQCKLSEATSSLIHSLQSPHCRLQKLVLDRCTIPTTDRIHLTTAIVSSTTITHLIFTGEEIDTPSLTALASGLKQNRTMEELAVNNSSCSKSLTKEQFQLLIEGVDSSAVKKLWLDIVYRKLLSDCPFSRDDVVVEWYVIPSDVYNKW